MSKKKLSKINGQGFGALLFHLRKARGITQTELASLLGVSQRVITYYENEAEWPPTHLLPQICQILGTSPNALLGFEPLKIQEEFSKDGFFWEKLREAEKLPPKDRTALLTVLEGLLAKNGKLDKCEGSEEFATQINS